MVQVCKTHILKFFYVLLYAWPVITACLFPFLFILLGQRRMIFFCIGVLEGGIRGFWFAVLGTTSKYVFLHISLTEPAQNTASLQYAD